LVDLKGKPVSFEKGSPDTQSSPHPVFAYGLKLPETRTPWAVTALVFVNRLIGLVAASFYLIVFDRNRQGLHDLAAGSYVVYADTKDR